MEFFDKDKKTVDEVMEKKLKFVFEMENEVKLYLKHVESFCNITKGKFLNL